MNSIDEKFAEWAKTLPKSMQQNIKDSADRGESFTKQAFYAGASSKEPKRVEPDIAYFTPGSETQTAGWVPFSDYSNLKPSSHSHFNYNGGVRHVDLPPEEIKDELSMPIPCDIQIGHTRYAKGTHLRAILVRMQTMYAMLHSPSKCIDQND
jgi:hypothetical protein